MKKSLARLVLLIMILAGCSRGAGVTPPPSDPASPSDSAPTPSAPPEPVQSVGTSSASPAAASLLPNPRELYGYNLSDSADGAEEYYVRDGERLIGSYNGKTFVTWFITDQGVWRQDPKGRGLLRYLPPVLKDGLAWKQASGPDEVWFLLRGYPACPHPEQDRTLACWELTVLNRSERTVYRMIPGSGIVSVRSEDRNEAGTSYVKSRRHPNPNQVPPPVEQLMREGARRPDGPLPAVTEATPAEFDQALRTFLERSGGTVLEVDLNQDGRKERIEGKIGQWTATPINLVDGNGVLLENAFPWEYLHPTGQQHRLEVVSVPGNNRPVLQYEVGKPSGFHGISLRWMDGDHLTGAAGFHPKTDNAIGGGIRIEPDGTVVITGSPAEMGGYVWTRRFRIETQNHPTWPYLARLESESLAPGPYPTDPQRLMTAAFVAAWFGRGSDLERYIPDSGQRAAFKQANNHRPAYQPMEPALGKLSWRELPEPVASRMPEVAPAPPGPDGWTEYLVWVGNYEGGTYYTGRVAFGPAADGRLVITGLEVGESGFIY